MCYLCMYIVFAYMTQCFDGHYVLRQSFFLTSTLHFCNEDCEEIVMVSIFLLLTLHN